jgi:DNA polymerase III subunit beta
MLFIKSTRDKLLKPLQIVSGIIEQRNALPILSNVLIHKNQEKIHFLGTDFGIQIKTSAVNHPPSDEENSITVPGKKFQDILRSLPSDIEVSLVIKDNRLQIKAGKSNFNLQTLPAEDFPEFHEGNELLAKVSLSQKQLKNLLHIVHLAIAQQDLRYYLKGLLLRVEDSYLTAIATDTHRLGYNTVELQEVNDKTEALIPRKTIVELNKLLNDNDESVTIEFFNNRIRFTFSNVILASKLIDGNCPDYSRAIPTDHTIRVELDRLQFLQALQRVSILANQNENFRDVRLILSNGILQITCKNIEQEDALEELEIQYDYKEKIDINFNITYLLELLNNTSCETIQCAYKDSNNSVLITIPGNKEFRYVVMPMRI